MFGRTIKLMKHWTLGETLITAVILLILAGMVGPSFRHWVRSFEHREETARVEQVIRKTIAVGMEKGKATRISIEGATIRGQITDDPGNAYFEDIHSASYTLAETSFVRNNEQATPWLSNTRKDSLNFNDPAATNGELIFSGQGRPSRGGAIFVQKDDSITGVIEVLSSGEIKVYRWENNEWSR